MTTQLVFEADSFGAMQWTVNADGVIESVGEGTEEGWIGWKVDNLHALEDNGDGYATISHPNEKGQYAMPRKITHITHNGDPQ